MNSVPQRHKIETNNIFVRAARLAPCLINVTRKCRFDDVGRFLEASQPNVNVIHQHIRAVSSHRRMPPSMANNRTHFIRGLTSFPDEPNNFDATNSILNDYNPTILPLYRNGPNGTKHTDLDETLLSQLTGSYHPDFTKGERDEVQYVSVFRSSNHYPRCIPDGFRKGEDKGYEWVNYPGLALLDKNLHPIKGADVLIDIEKYYFTSRDTRVFQDFTLYAGRTTEGNPKKDQLFLISNGMLAVPIAIRRRPPSTDLAEQEENWRSKINGGAMPRQTLHGDGLEVKMSNAEPAADYKEFLHKNPSVQVLAGKNMHFFESRNGKTFLEVWPHSNHTYAEVNLFAESFSSFGDYTLRHFDLLEFSDFNQGEAGKDIWQHFPVKGPPNRGTGCCADITLSDGRQMKLGISHFVVAPLTYLHRFYAFLPEEPFQVMSVSKAFCLGQMKVTDLNVEKHWLSRAHHSFTPRRTTIGRYQNTGVCSCPELTFASGISNKIGNYDYFTVSYGVDDCYSRSIVIHKDKIELMLFPSFFNGNGD